MTDKDTIIASQEVEILRLQQGFEDLKKWVLTNKYDPINSFQVIYIIHADDIIEQIDKITGASND